MRNMDMDAFDHKILDALQRDASRTNADIGAKIGLSASQVSRRRARLEQEGIIRRYRAEIDGARLGFTLTVFIHVTLATHSRDNARRLRDLVALTPAIQEAHALTGEADYLLKVAVAGLKELSDLVNEVLLPHEAVERVRSEIVLETLKDAREWPIA
jgi:DNA-binding Lrp family transcriptional regulator